MERQQIHEYNGQVPDKTALIFNAFRANSFAYVRDKLADIEARDRAFQDDQRRG